MTDPTVESSRNDRLESRLWSLVDLLARDVQIQIDRVYKGIEMSLDQYHKMVVLSAGAVAFVPAVLSQSRLQTNVWFLRRGVVSLIVTIVVGVIAIAVSRYLIVPLLMVVNNAYKRL